MSLPHRSSLRNNLLVTVPAAIGIKRLCRTLHRSCRPKSGLVDDSDLMRRSLRTLLEGQDHWKVCDEASNGQEAVTKFSHKKFDIVVLDFQMPVMDGLEAARQIIVRSPDTPILMVSMHASPQLAKEARKAGIRGVCGKADIKCVVEGIEALLLKKPYFHN